LLDPLSKAREEGAMRCNTWSSNDETGW
jgi:hypothetical protein